MIPHKVKDILLMLQEEPRFKQETLEAWALEIINECANQCMPDGNPMVAKQRILDVFKDI